MKLEEALPYVRRRAELRFGNGKSRTVVIAGGTAELSLADLLSDNWSIVTKPLNWSEACAAMLDGEYLCRQSNPELVYFMDGKIMRRIRADPHKKHKWRRNRASTFALQADNLLATDWMMVSCPFPPSESVPESVIDDEEDTEY